MSIASRPAPLPEDLPAPADVGPGPARVPEWCGEAPLVVVIVLNWCNDADTAECLRSLQQDAASGVVPLIVDNGSPDGSGARLRAAFPDVPYLQTGRNLGFTGGNNAGLRWAMDVGAQYAVVLNNDTIVEPGCIAALVAAARADDAVGAAAPKIVSYAEPERLWYAGGTLSLVRGGGAHRRFGERDAGDPANAPPQTVSFISGCCMLLTRDALRAVRGFDDGYFAYIEDADLSYRLAAAGFRLLYVPTARLVHKVPPFEAEPSGWQITQRDRNRRRFVRLHLGALRRAQFALWFYPTRLAHLGRYLLRGDTTRARAIWQGMR